MSAPMSSDATGSSDLYFSDGFILTAYNSVERNISITLSNVYTASGLFAESCA